MHSRSLQQNRKIKLKIKIKQQQLQCNDVCYSSLLFVCCLISACLRLITWACWQQRLNAPASNSLLNCRLVFVRLVYIAWFAYRFVYIFTCRHFFFLLFSIHCGRWECKNRSAADRSSGPNDLNGTWINSVLFSILHFIFLRTLFTLTTLYPLLCVVIWSLVSKYLIHAPKRWRRSCNIVTNAIYMFFFF